MPEETRTSAPAPADFETSAEMPVTDDLADVSGAAGAAAQLGGEYAPVVGIVLAGMAILGGSKAWAFYRERAEQRHELAMTELKMRAADPAVRPQPCQQAQAQVDQRLDEQDRKIAKLERHAVEMQDFDGEDMARRVKRIERRLREDAE